MPAGPTGSARAGAAGEDDGAKQPASSSGEGSGKARAQEG